MNRVLLLGTAAGLLCGVALPCLVSCGSVTIDPVEMTPPSVQALSTPLTADTIAVVDFLDERPDCQRGDHSLNDGFVGSQYFVLEHYWFALGERPGNLDQDSTNGGGQRGERRGRWTGTASFKWFGFPFTGVGSASSRPILEGLADYFALALERRGVAQRVVRVATPDQAARAGAQVILQGTLRDFAAVFAEIHPPAREPRDDPLDYRMHSFVGVDFALHHNEQLLWQELLRSEDEQQNLFDHMTHYRGTGSLPFAHLDETRVPRYIHHDLCAHVQRALHQVTASALSRIEQNLSPKVDPAPALAESGTQH